MPKSCLQPPYRSDSSFSLKLDLSLKLETTSMHERFKSFYSRILWFHDKNHHFTYMKSTQCTSQESSSRHLQQQNSQVQVLDPEHERKRLQNRGRNRCCLQRTPILPQLFRCGSSWWARLVDYSCSYSGVGVPDELGWWEDKSCSYHCKYVCEKNIQTYTCRL